MEIGTVAPVFEEEIRFFVQGQIDDFYEARTRVLEKLASIQSDLPAGVIPELGPEGAAEAYRWMAEWVATVIAAWSRPDVRRIAYFEPADKEFDVVSWMGPGFEYQAQPETDDLGVRIAFAFAWALSTFLWCFRPLMCCTGWKRRVTMHIMYLFTI